MIKAKYFDNHVYVKDVIPLNIKRNTILNISTNNGVTTYTHGFHKYPAKFIPHIPRWAINKYLDNKKNNYILDPFCGSGTTLVEGMLAGRHTLGIDIDPLSELIAKVKTTPIDALKLNEICYWLLEEIDKNNRQGTFEPVCSNIGHWFTQDAIGKLSLLRTLINEIPQRFGNSKQHNDILDLLLICFSSIIRRVSNADNESQKTYVSHTKVKKPEEAISLFVQNLNYFKERIIDFSEKVGRTLISQVICASSTEDLSKILGEKVVDIAITSPPYIKAIDYIYNQMVELFWIGDLFEMQTQTLQNTKKQHYIGTKHLSKQTYAEFTPFNITLGISKLDDNLKEVYENDNKNGHKHAYIAYKYFWEMEKHFIEMAKCLGTNTHYVMVAGDSSISGVPFETSEILISLADRNGFKLYNKWGYKIKNRYMRFDRKGRGGIIAIDWVLDFVKN